ncbi:MAG TPA: 3-deoxy-7-phosphoheptulonate synthase [Spirochaetales bacterium]|nr:3-deoxy-7-phosphoheptulonate synthase [Spirochaetales bacterium]HOV38376.1 3-deoxy-7-phosphoheptulonate synthase [Spirochaetales bacterium]
MRNTNDLRIISSAPLVPPRQLKEEFPMTEKANETVVEGRETIGKIIEGKDPRILAIVGPCSIHDPIAALDYAQRLAALRNKVLDKVYIVMRVYFEKPRTALGWRGMIFDPNLDGSADIPKGLRVARKLLLAITELGLPAGSEMLDPIVPQYITDLLSWASIGARTTESQIHREMASGLSMPVGFKNGTDGTLDSAINAMTSSLCPHCFIGIDQEGMTSILRTKGNEQIHLILRGGRLGPNYYEENVEKAEELLKKAGLPRAVVVDCSHMNSGRQHARQARVFQAFLDQKIRGRDSLIGFMLESNLFEGNQEIPKDLSTLKYGVSVTDACIGWEETERLLLEAYQAV